MATRTPNLGDIAIHTYKYKGGVYSEYVMWRRDPHVLTHYYWFNGQGEKIADSSAVQNLPSAGLLHAQLDFPDPLAYIPKLGDVATYKTGSGGSITVMYRYGRTEQGGVVAGWFTAQGSPKEDVESDSTFQLLIRDGQLQTDAN